MILNSYICEFWRKVWILDLALLVSFLYLLGAYLGIYSISEIIAKILIAFMSFGFLFMIYTLLFRMKREHTGKKKSVEQKKEEKIYTISGFIAAALTLLVHYFFVSKLEFHETINAIITLALFCFFSYLIVSLWEKL